MDMCLRLKMVDQKNICTPNIMVIVAEFWLILSSDKAILLALVHRGQSWRSFDCDLREKLRRRFCEFA